MESELKNVEGQPASLLCALQLCRQPCFCLHTVSTPWCTPTACSAWPCSPPVTPDGHRKEKAGKKGTESSGVTRTRCMYSIDFCGFGVLYEVMGKARKNTQEIQQVSFHSTVFFFPLYFLFPPRAWCDTVQRRYHCSCVVWRTAKNYKWILNTQLGFTIKEK